MKALGTFLKWLGIFVLAIVAYVWDPVVSGRHALGLALLATWVVHVVHSVEHERERERVDALLEGLREYVNKRTWSILERVREERRN